jgi:hypothetical protein
LKIALWTILLLSAVFIPASIGLTSVDAQSISRSQEIQLNVANSLIISSDQESIQRVLIQGNLSLAVLQTPAQYPTKNFTMASTAPGTYLISIFFDYAHDYQVNLLIQTPGGTSGNSTYYVSSGSFELDIQATFALPPSSTPVVEQSVSPWDGFLIWLNKFGQAFPLWVKLLYLALGFQFFCVGGLWIRRETAKKEIGPQHLDRGDRAFLWIDVACKFLLVTFLTIVAVMAGELLVLFILRFMFLASFDLLSLWDLFVVGFAAGAVIIAYLFRFTLERAFDMKPMEED